LVADADFVRLDEELVPMDVRERLELLHLLRVLHEVLRGDGALIERPEQLHRPGTIPVQGEHEDLFKFPPGCADQQQQQLVHFGIVLLLELTYETGEADGQRIERPKNSRIATREVRERLGIRETKEYLVVGHSIGEW
jgi:hypothetical protein